VKKIFQVSTPRDFVNGAIEAAAKEEPNTPGHTPVAAAAPAGALAEASDNGAVERPAAEMPSPRSAGMAIPLSESGEWTQPTAAQFEAMKLMCTVQLLMIKAVGELYQNHGSRLLSRHILILVEALEGACAFAHEFNGNRGARSKLWNPELIGEPPQLIEQEIQALKVYLTILFALYQGGEIEPDVRREMAEQRMMSTICTVLDRYITKTLKPTLVPEEVPEMMAFTPVVIQILQGINHFTDDQLNKHLPQLYIAVVEMTNCTKSEARMLVKDILIRVGTLKSIVG